MSPPYLSVAVAVALLAAFIVGLLLHTPPQACAEDPDCARAPVTR